VWVIPLLSSSLWRSKRFELWVSDNHFDTKIVVNGATPTWKGFTLGATIIGDGGSRYSFQSGGNRSTNGDFNLSNEIAYVLIPTTRIHHKTL
jgi:hypothetical protein